MKKKLSIVLATIFLMFCTWNVYATDKSTTDSKNQASATSPSEKSQKIDVNQATVKELTRLKGVGLKTAKRIVDYREQHGPFKKLEDLSQIPGMTANKVSKIEKDNPEKIVFN